MHGPSARRYVGRVAKLLVVALAPTVLLLGAGEGLVRYFALDAPTLASGPLYEEQAGITRPDPDLFWSVRPNLRGYFQDAPLTTNNLGLRGAEVGEKQPGEYRILCLGESTTFGFGVGDSETYAAGLERTLNGRGGGASVRVLNAGVTAYSSFQSLVYLERRGLRLTPDAVVLYHWANDFLPTSYRDSQHNEIGASRSDMELYAFYKSLYVDELIRHSALFRAGMNFLARRSVDRFRDRHAQDRDRVPPQLAWSPVFFPHESPVRVRPSERRQVLEGFLQLSKRHGFELVIVHPVYRDVEQHDELLVQFCREHDVPMIDAPAAFAAAPLPRAALFSDSMHPTVAGHALLARALVEHFRGRVPRTGGAPRP